MIAIGHHYPPGNCSYQYCSHTSINACPAGAILRLQCVVYNAANIFQVKWYHSQNENPTELNTTTGGRYTANETSVPPYHGCTGDDWRLYQLIFNYNETDSGSYWCQIVTAGSIHLDLSEPWMVDTVNFPNETACVPAGDTDSKCVAQPTATPILSSTTVLAQDSSTSAEGVTTKPLVSATTTTHSPVETPSVPSSSTAPPSTSPPSTTLPAGCTVGGTSCSVVYLAAGLGVLAVIVVLLVVIVVVLVCISVRRGKKEGKGEMKVPMHFSRHDLTAVHSFLGTINLVS